VDIISLSGQDCAASGLTTKETSLDQCKPLPGTCPHASPKCLGCQAFFSAHSLPQCNAVNGLSVTETWTLRASLLSYIMALTATIGEHVPQRYMQADAASLIHHAHMSSVSGTLLSK